MVKYLSSEYAFSRTVVFPPLALCTHKLVTSYGSFEDSLHSTFARLQHVENEDSAGKLLLILSTWCY